MSSAAAKINKQAAATIHEHWLALKLGAYRYAGNIEAANPDLGVDFRENRDAIFGERGSDYEVEEGRV